MSTFNRIWNAEFELVRAIGRGETILVINDAEEGPHIVVGDPDAIMNDLVDYFGETATWGQRGVSLTPASEVDIRTFLAECEDVMEMGTIEAADMIDDLMDRRVAARLRAGVA